MPKYDLFKIYSGIIFHVSFPGDISFFNQEIFRESRNSLKFSICLPFSGRPKNFGKYGTVFCLFIYFLFLILHFLQKCKIKCQNT